MPDSDTPQSSGEGAVFAIVIGINDYLATAEFNPLHGAVNDARMFEKFLRDPREQRGLGVPEANIVLLENKQATRKAILSTFQAHFLNNADIPDHGKATLILFYAGHGSRVEEHGNLIAPDERVEAICPVDERTMDENGEYVHAIPDYVLGWLLSELAAKKSPNITVILDACHSGGMGRDIGQARNARSSSTAVPLAFDSHLWEGKAETVQSFHLWAPAATSHVLLAACRQDETAREISYDEDNSVHGRFTSALIVRLRKLVLEKTTYAELLDCVPKWSGQNPHCSGSRRDRLVFAGNYPATGPQSFPLTKVQPDPARPDVVGAWKVKMGSIEGIVPGTEFAVHAPDNRHLGTLVAHSVQIGETFLVPQGSSGFPIPWGSRVVVSAWKNTAMVLRVYAAPDFPLVEAVFPAQELARGRPGRLFVRSPSAEEADLVLRCDKTGTAGEELVIEQRASTSREAERETRASLVQLGGALRIPLLIDGIAHFNYFLERHHGAAPLDGVSLEMHRLQGTFPTRTPDRAFGTDGNLVENGAVVFASDPSAKYAFTVRNESDVDLFPYLFYFDPVKYTIHLWYEPSGASGQAAPLKRQDGTVTIGMGSEHAFVFKLPDGDESSSGFAKLFVATQHLDLAWIQQVTSPLDPRFEGTPRDRRGESLGEVQTWDAMVVMLTMNN